MRMRIIRLSAQSTSLHFWENLFCMHQICPTLFDPSKWITSWLKGSRMNSGKDKDRYAIEHPMLHGCHSRNQIVREKELGLPTSPCMDIQTEAEKYEAEVNFINNFVKPLWGDRPFLSHSMQCVMCRTTGSNFSFFGMLCSSNESKRGSICTTCRKGEA